MFTIPGLSMTRRLRIVLVADAVLRMAFVSDRVLSGMSVLLAHVTYVCAIRHAIKRILGPYIQPIQNIGRMN